MCCGELKTHGVQSYILHKEGYVTLLFVKNSLTKYHKIICTSVLYQNPSKIVMFFLWNLLLLIFNVNSGEPWVLRTLGCISINYKISYRKVEKDTYMCICDLR